MRCFVIPHAVSRWGSNPLTTMPGAGFLTKLTIAPLSRWISFTVIPRFPTSSPWYLAYKSSDNFIVIVIG
jgi:hypothetical protein